MELFYHISLMTLSYLKVKEREEKDKRERKKQERENRRLLNPNRQVRQSNPYYRKTKDRKKVKKLAVKNWI